MSSTNPEWFPSPVKLNLFLHVTGRRNDGYHLLQTLFQFVEFGDDIGFQVTNNAQIARIDAHEFDLPDYDLCVAAAEQLRRRGGHSGPGVTITLRKKIPPGTGLGAGSSNAATTLLALNELWKIHLPHSALLEIAADLGADVPIFVYGRSAWAEGTGDRFSTCDPETGWVCVVLPDETVSTHQAFAGLRLKRARRPVTFADYQQGNTTNDFEDVVPAFSPAVEEALNFLRRFGNARMSGTGSAVFVKADSKAKARQIHDQLPPDTNAFIARASNVSPLQQKLAAMAPR